MRYSYATLHIVMALHNAMWHYAYALSQYILQYLFDEHYQYLLVVISQDEILLAATARGLIDIVKDALKKNANINGQDPDVSYSL